MRAMCELAKFHNIIGVSHTEIKRLNFLRSIVKIAQNTDINWPFSIA